MNKQKKMIISSVLLLSAIILVRYSPLSTVISFDNLKQNRDSLLVFVQEHYWLAVACYIAMYVAVTSFPVPAALVLTLAGGFLFGAVAGVLYIDIGATGGAMIAFLSARYLFGNWVQERYVLQLRKFNEEIAQNGASYFLTLRFIPLFPFFLINLLAGLTKVPLRTFLWTTLIGILPATAVFAFAGRQIGTINSPSEILSKKMLMAFLALALVTVLPAVLKRMKARKDQVNR
jgi:uncharacterized membrane protein YdjX (TVP38/TMEM64 family)